MNKLTMSYTVKSNGETNTLNFEKDFESIPTLQEVEEFVTGFIDGMDLEDGYECTCGCQDLNEEDEDAEFVLQMADMVEDVFQEQILEAVEEFADSVLDIIDATTDDEIMRLFAQISGTTLFDYFRIGYKLALNKVEDVILDELDEIRSEDEHDCDGCCEACAPSRLY